MSQMRIATGADYLGADHPITGIDSQIDPAVLNRLEIARPATTGLVLGVGTKQRIAATGTDISTRLFMLVKLPRKSRLGVFLAQNAIFLRGKELLPSSIWLVTFSATSGCSAGSFCEFSWLQSTMI